MKMNVLTQRILVNQCPTVVPPITNGTARIRTNRPWSQPQPQPQPSRFASWVQDEPGLVLAWQLLWLASWAAVLECIWQWLAG